MYIKVTTAPWEQVTRKVHDCVFFISVANLFSIFFAIHRSIAKEEI